MPHLDYSNLNWSALAACSASCWWTVANDNKKKLCCFTLKAIHSAILLFT